MVNSVNLFVMRQSRHAMDTYGLATTDNIRMVGIDIADSSLAANRVRRAQVVGCLMFPSADINTLRCG